MVEKEKVKRKKEENDVEEKKWDRKWQRKRGNRSKTFYMVTCRKRRRESWSMRRKRRNDRTTEEVEYE